MAVIQLIQEIPTPQQGIGMQINNRQPLMQFHSAGNRGQRYASVHSIGTAISDTSQHGKKCDYCNRQQYTQDQDNFIFHSSYCVFAVFGRG